LMAGPFSNKFGRRDATFFACFWWLIGTAVQVSCKNLGQLIAGRNLNGVCVGITVSFSTSPSGSLFLQLSST
jgi:MFS family permease